MARLRLGFTAVLLIGLVSFAVGQDKQKFEFKFEKDKVFYQKLTTKVDQTLKVQGGSDVPLKHEQTFYFAWTPTTVEKDKAVVKMKIEGVRFAMNIAQQNIEFDSTDATPGAGAGNPGLADFFRKLVGAELTVTYGPNNVVQKVDGREELAKNLASINPQMEQVLRSVLTDEALKEMADPALGITPPGEKAVNEKWEKKSTLSLGPIGSYDRTYEYTYKGKDADPAKKELDRIEVKPTLSYKPPASAQGLPFTIKGGNLTTKETKQGFILYNTKTGRVQEARIHIVMGGDLDVTIGTAETKVSLQQDQKTELDTSDTSFLPKKQP